MMPSALMGTSPAVRSGVAGGSRGADHFRRIRWGSCFLPIPWSSALPPEPAELALPPDPVDSAARASVGLRWG